jgi:group I intron endonuclease
MIIYKATFPNGKVYIGKTKKKLSDRVYHHIWLSGSKNKIIMSKAIKKYGSDNIKWEIIEECISVDDMSSKEILYIKKYNSNNIEYGYNITEGGDGGDTISTNENRICIIKKRLKSNGHNPDNYIPFTEELENEIITKYVEELYSIKKLVREYKISKNRITRLLKSKDIKIKQNMSSLVNTISLSDEQISNITYKHSDGKTIKRISEEEKLTIQTVSRVLHDLGIRISKRFKNGKRYDGKQPKGNKINI